MNAAELVVEGPAQMGEITGGTGSGWWRFELTETTPTVIDVTNTWIGTLADSVLTLYDYDLNLLAGDDDTGDAAMSRIIRTLDTGRYYARVKGREPFGKYLIAASRLNTLSPDCAPFEGNINGQGSLDWFILSISSAGWYRIATTAGSLTADHMMLYESDHNEPVLEDDTSGPDGMAAIEGPFAAATYYVKIRGRELWDTGSYEITCCFITHSISGSILKPNGLPISGGATADFGGVRPSVTTVGTGAYVQTGFTHGVNVTIKPSKTGWVFRPRNRTVTVAGDFAGQNFTGTIEGDTNFDCVINVLDMIFVRNKLNASVTVGDNWQADVNRDGSINVLDLIQVRNRLNTRCP